MSVAAMLGPVKTRRLVLARSVAMYLARRRLRCSYPELGMAFARDHKAALDAVRRIEAGAGDAEVRGLIERAEALLEDEAKRCA